MNIILQDNIDFYKELYNDDTDDEDENNICLLTKLPLDKNKIKLNCGHLFNFLPLYKEVCNQKCKTATSYLETDKLLYNEIKCPYCRQKQKGLLPHVKLNEDIIYISGVNRPEDICMDFHTCSYIFKSGKHKNTACKKSAYYGINGCYCNQHHIMINKNKAEESNNTNNHCCAILKSGKRKGEICNIKIKDNNVEYCRRHLSK